VTRRAALPAPPPPAAPGSAPGGGSYTDLLRGELTRKLRHVALAFYPAGRHPRSLFGGEADAEDWAGWALA
jgi:hypothetical protein